MHLPYLLPCPVRVQLGGTDKSQVNAEGTMDAGAIDADEDAVSHRGPRRVLCVAVKTNLVGLHGTESLEDLLDLRLGGARVGTHDALE